MMTLITPTGVRPKAWSICEQLMARQTYDGPVQWVIVDDGQHAQKVTFERPQWTLDVIQPKKKWRKGHNTQASNLKAALARADGDVIVVIEDDDYYRPDWLQTVADAIHGHHAVGEAPSRYYNVATGRYAVMRNDSPSLGCTAFRASLKGKLLQACQSESFIDVHFWRGLTDTRILPSGRVVGVKGLPGRAGIGVGHADHFGQRDDGSVLRQWVPDWESFYG